MPRPLTKPALYRLTLLDMTAVEAFAKLMLGQKPSRVGIGFKRSDGKCDVGITMGLLDQLQTASLAGENLSDTIVRVVKGAKL